MGFLDIGLLAEEPPTRFEPRNGKADASIFTVVVEAAGTAALVIPEEARGSVLLLDALSPPDSPPFDLADGVAAIELEACADRDTPFAPAMLAIGAQCVPIDVLTSDASSPTRVTMSFGAGTCRGTAVRFTG